MSTEFLILHFGSKLRALRQAHHLSLKELASELGYTSHGYISELERGKKQPTVEFVLKIARYFNISTDQLLKDELNLSIESKE
jgi:transcriptional regulator with XRE-family HTH domain